MFLGVQVKVSNPHIIKINDSAMTQHRAMYTGKRIIPQNILYIYIYINLYILCGSLGWIYFLANKPMRWLVGLKSAVPESFKHIYTNPQLYIIIIKKKKTTFTQKYNI